MRNLVLFGVFTGISSLSLLGVGGTAPQSQGPCVPTVHFVVEDLGPLHSPGLAQLPAPAGSLPLPEPWLQRCQIANVGTMNGSKDVVFTSVTAQGSRIYLADDQGLSVVADGTAIACHLGENGFISGRDAAGMALWYPASSAYHLYPYPITPPWAQPSSGILSGTSPKAHHVLQPGGLVQVVPAGSYLDNSATLDSLLGTWRQELSQVTSPPGQQLFLNGALGTSEGIAVFGSAAEAGWRPFHMTGSFTGFDAAVFHPLASTGAVHAMNEAGTTVGCARFPDLAADPIAFQEGARFQESPDDGLVGIDPEVTYLLDRSHEK